MALCLSCTPTPFDLTLSRAARTAEKMTRDNASSIAVKTDSYELDLDADFVFYPTVGSAGFDYGVGMIAWTEGAYVRVEAVEQEGGAWISKYTDQGQPIDNPDGHAPTSLIWPTKSGSPYLFCLTFDALHPSENNRYALLAYSTSVHSFTSVAGTRMADTATTLAGRGVTVIGASVTAEPNAAYDLTHWLARDDAGTGYVELAGRVLGPAIAAATNPAPRGVTPYALSFLPADLTRCMYYYDENPAGDAARAPNRSFASWYDESSGAWKCYAWWEETAGVIAASELSIPFRVDALLSSGQLLSTEDGTGRLYDRDGTLRAAFPLGNLAYIGEQFIDGAARTYFSQCVVYDQSRHFFVYWIGTSALATLNE
jgi:hypothetical protein